MYIKEKTGVLAIGWDVGGWMGKNHGVAACFWNKKTDTLLWLGNPGELNIPRDSYISLEYILSELVKNSENVDIQGIFESDNISIIVGVDAPLGVPSTFHKLLELNTNLTKNHEYKEDNLSELPLKPFKEIDNLLAYRYTDRFVYTKFNKKPLSAVFDRLGNNCTVAISHALKWYYDHSFKINPIHIRDNSFEIGSRQIIEVYPALVTKEIQSKLLEFLPESYKFVEWNRQHDFDAVICSIMAACHGAREHSQRLPELMPPPEDVPEIEKEGWIYYIPNMD